MNMEYDVYFTVTVTTKSKDRAILEKSDGTTIELPLGLGSLWYRDYVIIISITPKSTSLQKYNS